MSTDDFPVLGEEAPGHTAPWVYMAGPIDYVESQRLADHKVSNWRHRYFSELPIHILCPTCMNVASKTWDDVMYNNSRAVISADAFVGYFPGDVATFGTPIEIADWLQHGTPLRPGETSDALLIHPSKPGVFVQMYQANYGLVVVRNFEEARQWLRKRY